MLPPSDGDSRAAGFTPRVAAETHDLFSLLQLVRAGVGMALVPSAAAAMRVPGVALRPTGLPAAAWEISLVWRRSPERELLVKKFVAAARRPGPARVARD